LGDDWEVHETTVQRTVERVEAALIASGQFQLPGKKVLRASESVFEIITIDAAETPWERPKKAGRPHMGGVASSWASVHDEGAVLPKTAAGMVQRQEKAPHPENAGGHQRGDTHDHVCRHDRESMHDLTLFRYSGVRVHRETALIGDAGDEGIWRDHRHSITPHKESTRNPLTPQERQENWGLASTRLRVEHVLRRLKIFLVLKDMYRHRRRRFSLRVNRIAARCNHALAARL